MDRIKDSLVAVEVYIPYQDLDELLVEAAAGNQLYIGQGYSEVAKIKAIGRFAGPFKVPENE